MNGKMGPMLGAPEVGAALAIRLGRTDLAAEQMDATARNLFIATGWEKPPDRYFNKEMIEAAHRLSKFVVKTLMLQKLAASTRRRRAAKLLNEHLPYDVPSTVFYELSDDGELTTRSRPTEITLLGLAALELAKLFEEHNRLDERLAVCNWCQQPFANWCHTGDEFFPRLEGRPRETCSKDCEDRYRRKRMSETNKANRANARKV